MPEECKLLMNCEPEARSDDAGDWDRPWPQSVEEFERLVKALQDQLVRYAFRRLGNLHDAEDVAQDVFVKAYADRAKRKGVANVRAYLYRMAANRCIDLIRKRRLLVVPLEELSAADEPRERPGGPAAIDASEQLRQVEAMLGHIPPKQAEAIRLRLLDELSPTEIAKVLRCPVTAIKSRLRHGFERLRRMIAGAGER